MIRIEDAWISAPAPRKVMKALQGRAFFVGGCVRNALMGRAISDIDIATPMVPHEVERHLSQAGIKTVPTGLQHGTLTAVVDGDGIEVTTFRADVATDGRRAQVVFTDDMSVDAARRDFTMNALYAEADGTVIDPLGGLPDLQARRLRFIGRAEDRIREDYLRILRFFRFYAWYGTDGIDADGLAACAAMADGLDGLARERVGWEFRKLLSAVDPALSVASMARAGILTRCIPGADPVFLAPLVHVEAKAGISPAWPTRLAALGGSDRAGRLRLSRAEIRQMEAIDSALADPGSTMQSAYRNGAPATIAAALIRAATTGSDAPVELEEQARAGAAQIFPITASHLISAGIEPGAALGDALTRAEALWVSSGFSLDRDALIGEVVAGS